MPISDVAGLATESLHWPAADMTVGLDQAGAGRPILLLPALSSISTRAEMRPLMRELAAGFRVTSVDWPGFGEAPRPKADWSPDMLSAFLAYVLAEVVPEAEAVVAAGHAAAYALHFAAHHPGRLKQLVLVAPTWRGPLPTMMRGPRPWFGRIVSAFDAPLVGPALYRANVSRPVLRAMAREHVYEAADFADDGWLAAKRRVTRAAGARHASVRFVTGRLDRASTREELLDMARAAALPTLVVFGAGTPPRSRAEMEALAALPGVAAERLANGRLAVAEEFPRETAGAIVRFLAQGEVA